MRIALIVTELPAVSESFTVRRVVKLLERGWDIHIVCEKSSSDAWRWFPEAEAPLRHRVHVRPRRPSRRRVVATFPFILATALLRAPAATVRYLWRGRLAYGRAVFTHFCEDATLVRLQPDVIHFEFGHLAVNREPVGRLVGSALVASFQGYDLNYVGLDAEPGYYDKVWIHLDVAHFLSASLLERAERRGLPADASVRVVMNGVDPAFDGTGRTHVDAVGSVDRPLRILSVGRLHWKKGYIYSLQAVRELRDAGLVCQFRIVGDGDGRDEVLFERQDLGLVDAVALEGALGSDRVRELMGWADVLVHGAVSEGFCIAVAEAQAMGLPVVATDADGLRENVVDGETGYIVARRDATALAERIRRLAADPDLRQRMGRAGVVRIRSGFSLDAHVDGIESVYREAASSRRR